MAEDYQHIIRGSPVERKPDPRALDAALQADLNYHDPTLFVTAVAEATVGANLIKELFDVKIAQMINSPSSHANPQIMHICDPALYNSAITDATLNGQVHQGFFNKFVAGWTVYQVVRTEHGQSTEPRDPYPTQVTQTHQSYADQVHNNDLQRQPQALYTPRALDNEISHEDIARSRSAQRQQQAPLLPPMGNSLNDNCFSDQLPAQPRLRHAEPLPDQSDVWAAVRKGREYEASRRRSRSPDAFDQSAPSDRTRRQLSHIESRREEGATLDDHYRDRGPALRAGTLLDHECDDAMQHTPALPAPDTAQRPSHPASPGHVPLSTFENTARRELCLETSPKQPIDEHEPGSAHSNSNYPPPCRSPSHDDPGHVHNPPADDRDRVQGGRQGNSALMPTATTLHPSAIEPRIKKNLSAVCIE